MKRVFLVIKYIAIAAISVVAAAEIISSNTYYINIKKRGIKGACRG